MRALHLFVGTLYNYKLDSKGRLSIPTKWRERLGKEFYMVAVTVKGCKFIILFPTDEFENTYNRMQRGSENHKYETSKDFLRNAEECTLDSQGRFTLNQRLKELAYLENDSEVVFVGNGKTLEIWNNDEFEKMQGTFDSSMGIYDLMDKVGSSAESENPEEQETENQNESEKSETHE